MRKVCVLFTSEYPFSTGEPFLETEIHYLSQAFDCIYICPIFGKRSSAIREVPNNCFVLDTRISKLDIRDAVVGMFTRSLEERRSTVLGFRKWIAEQVFKGRAFLFSKRLKKAFNNIDFSGDECVFYTYWANYICTGAILAKQMLKKRGITISKIVSRAHGCDVYSERKGFCANLPLQEFNISHLDALYVCSSQGECYLKDRYPHLKDKIFTSHLGVDLSSSSQRGSLKAKTFLTVAFFFPVKRLLLFSEAFVRFVKKHPDWTWISIGGEGKELSKVKRLLKSEGVEKNVSFLGALHNADVYRFYENNKVSFLVNSSKTEGLPVSIMEAQSHAVPCIAPKVGGIPEIVDSSNGVLFDVSIDPEGLSSLLDKVSSLSEKDYLKLSEHSLETWKQKFDASKNYEEWMGKLLPSRI